jgi:hypothetical protein
MTIWTSQNAGHGLTVAGPAHGYFITLTVTSSVAVSPVFGSVAKSRLDRLTVAVDVAGIL